MFEGYFGGVLRRESVKLGVYFFLISCLFFWGNCRVRRVYGSFIRVSAWIFSFSERGFVF